MRCVWGSPLHLSTNHWDRFIYIERTLLNGKTRSGILGKIDLEKYDFTAGSTAPVRATEETVLSRIPPRCELRADAIVEFPHIMVFTDDITGLFSKAAEIASDGKLLYDFDLMQGGGHITGRQISGNGLEELTKAISENEAAADIPYAIGDGNHSLASAKASYEEIKAEIGAEAAKDHPARYALCEVVNLHDSALDFEPIYRVMFGVDPIDVVNSLAEYAESVCGTAEPQNIKYIYGENTGNITVKKPSQQLTVGTLQSFIDEYISAHEGSTVDYIHDEESARRLAAKENAVGFLFDGMTKDSLFLTVMLDGALPRKTFSMGHARDKRYYLEARVIK